VTLNEIFLLHLNLRFSSQRGFERVSPILCTALAALNPLTGLELYHSVNSLQVGSDLMSWEDFSERMKVNNFSFEGKCIKMLIHK